MSRILLLIGAGGFIGSILRYLVSSYFSKFSSFPLGTLMVNIIGCLVVGLLFGLSERHNWFSGQWQLFLLTGFCGGFTTFSAFAYENIKLLQEGNYLAFAGYTLASVALGLAAVFGGLLLAKI
ncbi:MAG: fluoride efflux transporter CrcB [Flavobacteriales bacterium]